VLAVIPALRFLALALCFALAGCGFKLRGTQQLPFESIYLAYGTNSALGAELARNIRNGSATRVLDTREQAQAILEVLGEARGREVLSVNAQGRAREYTLKLTLAFRVHDGKGREFIAPTAVTASRDLAFNETEVLAKESEEALLYRDMQSDLVQQVLRRLAALKV
jgi:LPS-assembly lipoprotein